MEDLKEKMKEIHDEDGINEVIDYLANNQIEFYEDEFMICEDYAKMIVEGMNNDLQAGNWIPAGINQLKALDAINCNEDDYIHIDGYGSPEEVSLEYLMMCVS